MHRVPILLFLFSCVLKSTPIHGLSWQKRLLHEYYQDFNIETGLDSEAKNDGDVEHTIDSLLHKQPEQTNTELDCGPPPEKKNARVEFSSTTVGNNATYICKIEIGVSIFQNAICQDDGSWSSHQLACLDKADLSRGCYVDSSDRDLDGDSTRSDLNTPEFCINYCSKQGFPYASVQYTSECYCGESFGKHGKADEKDCNIAACAGDPKEVCGGVWRQRVYSTVVNCGSPPEVQNAHVSHTSTTPGSDATYTCNIQVGATISWNTECQDNGTWTTADLFCVGRNDLFIGCYTDNRYRDLDGGFTNSRMNTPEFCINYCLQAGFRYAAVQFTTECYCGDTYGKHGLAPENECNQPCPGDPEEICGGSWRQRVYNTKLS